MNDENSNLAGKVPEKRKPQLELPWDQRLSYTPAEFAAAHGHAPIWAYRLLYKGRIKAIKDAGRLRIPRAEVERFNLELVFHDGGTSK